VDTESLRWLLVTDWAEIENTPSQERRPAELHRWRHRARCLAEMQGRPIHHVVEELQDAARALAAEHRRDLEAELARDLAFQRATGRPAPPPWNRRLGRLASASGRPLATVRAAVEQAAAAIRVVFAD
jgi:hypothetical protein